MTNQPGYSLQWCNKVAVEFQAKYARASDFFMRLYQINTEDLAKYISRSDPFWTEFKKECKVLDRIHPEGRYPALHSIIDANIKALKDRVNKSNLDHRLLTRLEKLRTLRELEEKQGFGPEGSATARPEGPKASFSPPLIALPDRQLCFEFA